MSCVRKRCTRWVQQECYSTMELYLKEVEEKTKKMSEGKSLESDV